LGMRLVPSVIGFVSFASFVSLVLGGAPAFAQT
jgi:hypothetical protein